MEDKKIIIANIKELVESDFYYEVFSNLKDKNNKINDDEKLSSYIFNIILIICQLEYNLEICKEIIIEILRDGQNSDYIKNELFVNYVILDILKSKDDYYKDDGVKKIAERLYHGFSVHFTTTNIMKKIELEGNLKAHNSMFPKEMELEILNASKYQLEHASKEELDKGYFISQGFGFSKGISMGAQTCAYWMNHTPESLSFLFGGNVYTRNKKAALEFVNKSISSLPEDKKKELLKIINIIWDDLIGDDKSLGAILIDRDSLEYETVTYYYENPPKKEQIRPYRNGEIKDIVRIEEDRYEKDIPLKGLSFLRVPSIMQLNKYYEEKQVQDKKRH